MTYKKGVTLIEVLFVLGILSILIGIVMIFYSRSTDRERQNEMATELNIIITTIHNLYNDKTNYNDLSSNSISWKLYLPAKFIKNNILIDSYGNSININPTQFNKKEFMINYTQIPYKDCIAFLNNDFGDDMFYTSTGNQFAVKTPLAPASSKYVCGGYDKNANPAGTYIYFVFK